MVTRGDFNRLLEKECGRRPKYLRDFWEYHDNNPDVFEGFVAMAKHRQRKGARRISISKLTEDMRDGPIQTVTENGLKLKNVLRAYYARFLIMHFPSLEPLMALRPLGEKRRTGDPEPVPYDPKNGVAKGRRLGVLYATGLWPEEHKR